MYERRESDSSAIASLPLYASMGHNEYRSFVETLQAKRYMRTAFVTTLRVAMGRIGAVMRLGTGLWSKVVGMGME